MLSKANTRRSSSMITLLLMGGIVALLTQSCNMKRSEISVPQSLAAMERSDSEDSAPVDVHQSFGIVPDHCESPLRGHFDKIYENGTWGKKLRDASDYYSDAAWPTREIKQLSASGRGSDLGAATQNSLKIVNDAITEFGVKSMIDIPCGDVNWIFDSLQTDTLPLYLGLDIAGAMLKINKERYDHHRNKQFLFWDASECQLPKFHNGEEEDAQAFDLVHVRDVIQHMTLDQGVQFFCNVFASGARVLITTTYPSATANTNIAEGRWYQNNLLLEPFSFPQGKCSPTHGPGFEMDHTCVYDLTENWVQEFMSTKCQTQN